MKCQTLLSVLLLAVSVQAGNDPVRADADCYVGSTSSTSGRTAASATRRSRGRCSRRLRRNWMACLGSIAAVQEVVTDTSVESQPGDGF